MHTLTLLAALALFLGPGIVLAAPSFAHDVVDYQPPVPTVRIAVVGTTAFITFIVLTICLFLFAQRRGSRRRHGAGARRQNALGTYHPRLPTDIMFVERAFARSFAAGAFVMGSHRLALIAAPPTALRPGPDHAHVYGGSSVSTSSASLRSSLESDITDPSLNNAVVQA
ncbi:hypothetical protein EWM64_g9584 [Hericium alpestre]|uniref:Uncharacterized protein n=1 Tax=Hericium alpestre TaxID=135208 RepID=A0A4Y9ZLM0_9AGAM|nr:hypothetical protein EWM64_g9584 [Hericium alpestre]